MDHLIIFQFGDLREACTRFDAGGEETYLDQRRSVDFLREMARSRPVTVVSVSDEPHDELIEAGLRSIGVPLPTYFATSFAASILARVQPGIAVAAIPDPGLLRALEAAAIPSFVCLADVMRPVRPLDLLAREGLRRARLNHHLRRLLRGTMITAIGNHSLSASRSLHSVLGLPSDQIIPWEWSRVVPDSTPKSPPAKGRYRLFYAGMLVVSKGVGDLLEAAALLTKQGYDLRLDIAGRGGDQGAFEERSRQPDLAGRVTFLGLIPNSKVRSFMRASDAVIVPSHHDYAEGLPNTIFEALGSRTPLVMSDHPAYSERIKHGTDALLFQAGQPANLAAELVRLLSTPELYASLSRNAPQILDRLYVGVSWYELITSFTTDPKNETGWVAQYSLAEVERRLSRAS